MSDDQTNASEDQAPPSSEEGKVIDLNQARRRGNIPPVAQVEEDRRKRDRMIERFNRNWCVCDDHGTVSIFKLIKEVDQKMRPGHETVYRLKLPDFLLYHRHKPLTYAVPAKKDPNAVELVTKSVGVWWIEHPDRLTYPQVAFLPGVPEAPNGCFNLWRGWGVDPVRPRRGTDWPLMRRHLYEVICSGNEEWFEFLINWLAYMVQHPGEVGHIAVVLRGGEGVGKGFFANYLMRILGPHALHLRNAEHIYGKYNLHLQNCILLLSDEAYWPGDKQMEGVLRALITEERLPVEGKYQNLFETHNCVHVLIFSNNDWVVPMATDARRFFVLDVPDTHRGDTAYWDALGYELEHGGPAAMLGELLLDRNIKYFNPRVAPDTPASREQRLLSLDTIKQYLLTALDRGYVYQPEHRVASMLQWHPFTTRELWWNGYIQWCDRNHRYQRQSREQLFAVLKTMFQEGRPEAWSPTHELKHADPGRHRQDDNTHQNWLTMNDTGEPIVDADRLPDDPAGAIVCQKRMRGFHTLSLEDAQDRFDACWGPLDTPWQSRRD